LPAFFIVDDRPESTREIIMARCLLALGSNLGDRREMLSRATLEAASLPNSRLLSRSQWQVTEPIGGPGGQGAFLNGCLLLDTQLDPAELSTAVHEIERQLGRQRVVRWDARAIDIDLLLYDLQEIETEQLIIPHPRMSFRRFVLEPACEIAGSMIHPSSGWTLARLLRHLGDAPRYVAVAAAEPASACRLATELCQALGSPKLERQIPDSAAGPDSLPSEGVEFTQGMADMLRESRWRQVPELAARLPLAAEPSLPPVVSSFWCEGAEAGLVHPAVVIAWEKSSPAKARAVLRKMLDRPGHGPMARIQGEDFPAVLSEALAAIRAVWPTLPVGEAS